MGVKSIHQASLSLLLGALPSVVAVALQMTITKKLQNLQVKQK